MSVNPRIFSKTLKKRANSWYFRVGNVHNFFCKCGNADQYKGGLPSIEHHPNHRCSKCGNRYYVDSEMFLHDHKIKIWKEIHTEATLTKDDKGWLIECCIRVPKFDVKSQSIYFHKIEVSYLVMSFDGFNFFEPIAYELTQREVLNGGIRSRKLKELLEKEMNLKLLHFIERTPHKKIEWLMNDPVYLALSKPEERFGAIEYFLHFDKVKTFEFFRWKHVREFAMVGVYDTFRDLGFENDTELFDKATIKELLEKVIDNRREKSVRKACFKAYEEAMRLGMYDPRFDVLSSRYITDTNLLRRIVSLNVRYKQQTFEETGLNQMRMLFELLTRHYSEKAIVEIFERAVFLEEQRETMKEVCWMLQREDGLLSYFERTRANIMAIHDGLILARRKVAARYSNMEFKYSPDEYKAETTFERFKFVLPKTATELDEWAAALNNCMFGYLDAIAARRTVIYVVFCDDELLYAIEVNRGKIIQALGKYNKEIDKRDRKVIGMWFKKYLA